MAERNWRDWGYVALAVWIAIISGVAIHGYLYPNIHTVFDIYRDAARKWWTGDDIYARGRDFYRYSPLFAVTISPLALLPQNMGNAAWKLTNGVGYGLALIVFARRFLPAGLGRTHVAVFSLLALPLAVHSLHIGQANLLMLGAMLLGMAAAVQDHWNRSAAWIAFATLIKGYPIALALVLSAMVPRKFALRYAVALGAGLLLPFTTQAPTVVAAQYQSWFRHLSASEHLMRERLRSIDNLLLVLGHPLSSTGFAFLGAASGIGVLGLCLYHTRCASDRKTMLLCTFFLCSIWIVLFGPATESCTYAVVAPTIAWALLDVFRRPTLWISRSTLVASLLLMGVLSTDLFPGLVRDFVNEHAGQPIGALLLFAFLMTRIGRLGDEAIEREGLVNIQEVAVALRASA
jgi:hypothetical protein